MEAARGEMKAVSRSMWSVVDGTDKDGYCLLRVRLVVDERSSVAWISCTVLVFGSVSQERKRAASKIILGDDDGAGSVGIRAGARLSEVDLMNLFGF